MNSKLINLKIALLGRNISWETILTQEGFFYEYIEDDNDLENFNVFILHSETKSISYSALINFLKRGGLVLAESRIFFQLSGEQIFKKKVKSYLADTESAYCSVGLVDIENDIYFTNETHFLDENLKIASRNIGNGHLILLPYELNRIFSNTRFLRRKFYFPNHELPSEDVSIISKNKFAEIIRISLAYLFDKKHYPLVSKWYYPNGFRHFFKNFKQNKKRAFAIIMFFQKIMA